MSKRHTVRINLEVSPKIADALDVICDENDFTRAQAARRSISIYSFLLKEVLSGGSLIVRDQKGSEKQILLR